MSPGFLPTIFQTNSVAYQNGNIDTATINLYGFQLSDESGFLFYLSNDGGTTWEQETFLGVPHTFLSTGDDLRLRIIGNPGESITLKDSEGNSKPLTIKYTYT